MKRRKLLEKTTAIGTVLIAGCMDSPETESQSQDQQNRNQPQVNQVDNSSDNNQQESGDEVSIEERNREYIEGFRSSLESEDEINLESLEQNGDVLDLSYRTDVYLEESVRSQGGTITGHFARAIQNGLVSR